MRFSGTFCNVTNSSKVRVMFLVVTLIAESFGIALTSLGGKLSLGPPPGGTFGTFYSYTVTASGAPQLALGVTSLGGDALVGCDLDYQVLGKNGSMLMVSVNGTAVKLR